MIEKLKPDLTWDAVRYPTEAILDKLNETIDAVNNMPLPPKEENNVCLMLNLDSIYYIPGSSHLKEQYISGIELQQWALKQLKKKK